MKLLLILSLLTFSLNAFGETNEPLTKLEELELKEVKTVSKELKQNVENQYLQIIQPKMNEISILTGIGITGSEYDIAQREAKDEVGAVLSLQYVRKYVYYFGSTPFDLGFQYSTTKVVSIVPTLRFNDLSIALPVGYGITGYEPTANSFGSKDEGEETGLVLGLQLKKYIGNDFSILGELKTNTSLQIGLGYSF